MEDSDTEDLRGAPFEMVVERGKIREFASATKTRDPQYFDGPEPISPPTFLSSAAFWQNDSSSPRKRMNINLQRLLHGEQRYVFHGPPPRAGAQLTGQVRVGDTWEKPGRRGGMMRFTQMTTEFRDNEGTLVAETISTLIETSQAVEDGASA